MKNELGIEMCCENCENAFDGCYGDKEEVCQSQDYCFFVATTEAYKQRIKVLQQQVDELESENNGLNEYYQQQQLTTEELQFIKNRLDECIEEWDVPEMVFMAHQILKKIEQTLKNLEGNLNKQ